MSVMSKEQREEMAHAVSDILERTEPYVPVTAEEVLVTMRRRQPDTDVTLGQIYYELRQAWLVLLADGVLSGKAEA
jgi:hypothetical protein